MCITSSYDNRSHKIYTLRYFYIIYIYIYIRCPMGFELSGEGIDGRR